jgi:hypothetical protein
MAPQLLLDTVVMRALGAALSAILLIGAWTKLRDRALFQASLENYQLLPAGLLPFAAWLLPLWELTGGVMLLALPSSGLTFAVAGSLLLLVSSAVAINLLRGHRQFDCGCGGLGGHVGDQSLSWSLVARNALLLLALGASVGDSAARELVWVDYLSVGGATLALLALYASANQLIVNQPRLLAMRKH